MGPQHMQLNAKTRHSDICLCLKGGWTPRPVMVNGFLSDVHRKHLDLWHKNLDSCSENIAQKIVLQGCLGFFFNEMYSLEMFL